MRLPLEPVLWVYRSSLSWMMRTKAILTIQVNYFSQLYITRVRQLRLGKVPLTNGSFWKLTELSVNEPKEPLIFISLTNKTNRSFELVLITATSAVNGYLPPLPPSTNWPTVNSKKCLHLPRTINVFFAGNTANKSNPLMIVNLNKERKIPWLNWKFS